MKNISALRRLFALACVVNSGGAFAQSSVTLYGVLDTFVGYQSAQVGGKSTRLLALANNGEMTSRWGLRGVEDLGSGYSLRFDLENGFDPSTGTQQNSFRLFDRQAWVGLAGNFGEVRFGRQNTPMFVYGTVLDAFGSATYGSGYNDFANWLSRVDNDISYISPKIANTQIELHYSAGGVPGSLAGNAVYQASMQSQLGPLYLAGAYLNAANATNSHRVQELMAGATYDYGQGKVYLAWFRANEVISATTGNALANPAGKYDPSVGPVGNVPGNYHSTYSVSADYRIMPDLSAGGAYAYIKDDSSLGNNAEQIGAIVNYSLSKRTQLYAVASWLKNFHSAQFRMAGASITLGSLLTPDRGHNEMGAQIGIRHQF
ncbi:Outer membrane porin protein 32 [Paraburkholderia nemoris]|uniref:Outer membrane porin protein 32 n=1 Tax=Paraburkholderia nemoris TaxID=2793076 RepID=A0ABN7MF50_9BURK|nr:porin [Paraburkholderia aspalathi]CAE6686752.1 Outer membrane porin protein 32 [Paraburkholderia nemoris]CAE6800201.1 Outer membrane porin protein 32 [Paraburkholderia nemoris]